MKKPLSKLFIGILALSSVFLASCSNGSGAKLHVRDFLGDTNTVSEIKHDEEYDVDYRDIRVNAYFGSSDDYLPVNAVYSDDVFFKPSTEYNHFLARMSMGSALASYTVDGGMAEDGGADAFNYFIQCGFENPRMDEYFQETSLYTVASLISAKKIQKGTEEATVVAVSVRSGKYGKEWMSNFNVESGYEEHLGFSRAADLVVDRTMSYVNQHHISGNIKFWVAGFSRGAAISNLIAARLNNTFRSCCRLWS